MTILIDDRAFNVAFTFRFSRLAGNRHDSEYVDYGTVYSFAGFAQYVGKCTICKSGGDESTSIAV